MPFDRLVQAMDLWAGQHPECKVLAQIGISSLQPKNIEYFTALTPAEFRARVAQAEIIVAHAGMGSVLTALEYSKPLVLLPRRGDLRETRNDHQLATARWLAQKPGIRVAMEVGDLPAAIAAALDGSADLAGVAPPTPSALIDYLRHYLDDVAAGRE